MKERIQILSSKQQNSPDLQKIIMSVNYCFTTLTAFPMQNMTEKNTLSQANCLITTTIHNVRMFFLVLCWILLLGESKIRLLIRLEYNLFLNHKFQGTEKWNQVKFYILQKCHHCLNTHEKCLIDISYKEFNIFQTFRIPWSALFCFIFIQIITKYQMFKNIRKPCNKLAL